MDQGPPSAECLQIFARIFADSGPRVCAPPGGVHEGLLERDGHHRGVLRPHLFLSHRGVSRIYVTLLRWIIYNGMHLKLLYFLPILIFQNQKSFNFINTINIY